MNFNQVPTDQVNQARQIRQDNKIQPTHAPGQNPFAQPQQPPQAQNPFAPPTGQPQQQQNPFAPPQVQQLQSQNPFAPPTGQPQQQNTFAPPQQPAQGFGNGFNTTQPPQNQYAQQNQYTQQPPVNKGFEDRLGDGLEAGALGIWGFFKEVAASFKHIDVEHLRAGANRTFFLSIGVTVSAGALGFFKQDIWWIAGGAALTIPVSMIWSKALTYRAKGTDTGQQQPMQPIQQDMSQEVQTNPMQTQQPMQQPIQSQVTHQPFEDEELDLFDDDDEEEDEEYDLYDDEEYDLYDDEEDDEDEEAEPLWKRNLASYQQTPTVNTETALKDLDSINPSMVSRQFLLESFLKATQSITPDYYQKVEVDEDSQQFDEADAIIKDIFSVLGFNDDEDLPDLQVYNESLFVDELIVNRPQKNFKVENFDTEYTQILRKGYNGQGGNIRMFSKSELIGRTLVIRIFKGVSPMVSMRDVIAANKGYYLDTDNAMPLILAIDEEGKEIKMDYLEEDGLIISGKKRSGKSYTLRSILSQMMLFNGPSKVNFYIGDVKGAASDYYKMRTPHVKRFESEPMKVLKMLEHIVTTEAKRREQRFKEVGVIKIDDYHSAVPDATDMPYLYVVIDEMVALTTKLKELSTKETDYKALYYGYLTALVTMLPAYGIRLIAVPHRITNDFLPKTASDNTTFKIAVRADEGLLKETLGLTVKQFGYDTPSKGDLAIKCTLVRPEPFYARSIVPATTTDISDKVFDFQAKLWAKLEPDSVADSVMIIDTQDQAGVQQSAQESHVQRSPYAFQSSQQQPVFTKPSSTPFKPTVQGLSLEDIEAHERSQNQQQPSQNYFTDEDDDFI